MEKRLLLRRISKRETYTIGHLYIDGVYFCDTLEDHVREGLKIKNETAIPVGKYVIHYTFSGRFQKYMPILLNVPNFEGIRIHSGNTNKDTSGCILVGKNTIVGKLTDSNMWATALYPIIEKAIQEGYLVTIQIV